MFKVNIHTDFVALFQLYLLLKIEVKTLQSTKTQLLIIPAEINRGKSLWEILSCIQRESEKGNTKVSITYTFHIKDGLFI
jgi:hypothetical protein